MHYGDLPDGQGVRIDNVGVAEVDKGFLVSDGDAPRPDGFFVHRSLFEASEKTGVNPVRFSVWVAPKIAKQIEEDFEKKRIAREELEKRDIPKKEFNVPENKAVQEDMFGRPDYMLWGEGLNKSWYKVAKSN